MLHHFNPDFFLATKILTTLPTLEHVLCSSEDKVQITLEINLKDWYTLLSTARLTRLATSRHCTCRMCLSRRKIQKPRRPSNTFWGNRKNSDVILIDVGPYKKETLSELFEGCYWNEKYSDRALCNGMQIIQCDSFETYCGFYFFHSIGPF